MIDANGGWQDKKGSALHLKVKVNPCLRQNRLRTLLKQLKCKFLVKSYPPPIALPDA
jgi:hypothetical protein